MDLVRLAFACLGAVWMLLPIRAAGLSGPIRTDTRLAMREHAELLALSVFSGPLLATAYDAAADGGLEEEFTSELPKVSLPRVLNPPRPELYYVPPRPPLIISGASISLSLPASLAGEEPAGVIAEDPLVRYELCAQSTSCGGGRGWTSAAVSVVPEPGTITLVAVGLAGMAMAGRRRRSTTSIGAGGPSV